MHGSLYFNLPLPCELDRIAQQVVKDLLHPAFVKEQDWVASVDLLEVNLNRNVPILNQHARNLRNFEESLVYRTRLTCR